MAANAIKLRLADLKTQLEYAVRQSESARQVRNKPKWLEKIQTLMAEIAVLEEAIEGAEPIAEPIEAYIEPERQSLIDHNRFTYDFEYFASLLKIRYRRGMTKGKERSGPFILNKAQKLAIGMIIKLAFVDRVPVRVNVLKSRQLGFTTLLLAFFIWVALTNKNFVYLIIIDRDDHMALKKAMIMDWLDTLSKLSDAIPKLKSGSISTKIWTFTNGSSVIFDSAKSINPGTSENPNALHLSEEPKWPSARPEQVKASLFPGIEDDELTFIIRESTAFGLGLFQRDFIKATQGRGTFIPIFVPWFMSEEYTSKVPQGFKLEKHLGRYQDFDQETNTAISEADYKIIHGLTNGQIAWRRRRIDDMGLSMFDQEFPTTPDHAFRSTQLGFFPTTVLTAMEKGSKTPIFVGDIFNDVDYFNGEVIHFSYLNPGLRESPAGGLSIYKNPVPGEKYFIGVDVAEGIVTLNDDGQEDPDWTVFYLTDSKGELCALYRGREKPEDSWLPLILLGVYYNLAVINGEINNVGALLYLCIKTGYTELLVHDEPRNRSRRDRTWTRTTPITRKIILQDLRSLWKENPRLCCSRVVYEEGISFIIDSRTGKPSAANGFKDDTILAAAICEHGRRAFYRISTNIETVEELIEEEQIRDYYTIKDTELPWEDMFLSN